MNKHRKNDIAAVNVNHKGRLSIAIVNEWSGEVQAEFNLNHEQTEEVREMLKWGNL